MTARGFTLIELLICIALIAVIVVIVIAAINPLEQLNRAYDQANESNAGILLSAIDRYKAVQGKKPDIETQSESYDCQEIVEQGPVFDYLALRNELSDWFPKIVGETNKELFVGIDSQEKVKVCYRVQSVKEIGSYTTKGCNIAYLYYH